MNATAAALRPYLERHRRRPAARTPWLHALRTAALERAAARGLPGPREEAWKYTSTRPLEQRGFAPPTAAQAPVVGDELLAAHLLPESEALRVVCVNGRLLAPALPSAATASVKITPLNDDTPAAGEFAAELEIPPAWRDDVFVNLNTAFFEQALVVEIAADAQPDKPLEILHIALADAPAPAYHPRLHLRLGRGARLRLIERYAGDGAGSYFTNAFTRIRLEERAELEHLRLQTESPRGFHLGRLLIEQSAASRYRSHNIHAGGAWVRLDLNTRLAGAGAHAELLGLYAVGNRQHLDNHTCIEHLVPRTGSEELYHGLLDGQGRAVFNGKVMVAPGAVKTEARQANHNLLLSRGAEIDSKPELEIYADDVKCNHGATIGQLDDAQIDYLRSRGLDESSARSLLMGAFANVLLMRLPLPALRSAGRRALERVLGKLHLPEVT